MSARAVIAGTIASNSGKAKAVPIPCKNVRRGKDFLVMNMIPLSSFNRFKTQKDIHHGKGIFTDPNLHGLKAILKFVKISDDFHLLCSLRFRSLHPFWCHSYVSWLMSFFIPSFASQTGRFV